MNQTLDKLTENEFMQPVIYFGRFFEVETDQGTEFIDQELIGFTAHPDKKDFTDYIEGNEIYSYRLYDGYGAYFSAPGYMARTDLTVFETEAKAEQFLIDQMLS